MRSLHNNEVRPVRLLRGEAQAHPVSNAAHLLGIRGTLDLAHDYGELDAFGLRA